MGDIGELQLAGCIRYGLMRNEVWSTEVTHSSHVEASSSGKILLFLKISSIFLVQMHDLQEQGVVDRRKTDVLQDDLSSQ